MSKGTRSIFGAGEKELQDLRSDLEALQSTLKENKEQARYDQNEVRDLIKAIESDLQERLKTFESLLNKIDRSPDSLFAQFYKLQGRQQSYNSELQKTHSNIEVISGRVKELEQKYTNWLESNLKLNESHVRDTKSQMDKINEINTRISTIDNQTKMEISQLQQKLKDVLAGINRLETALDRHCQTLSQKLGEIENQINGMRQEIVRDVADQFDRRLQDLNQSRQDQDSLNNQLQALGRSREEHHDRMTRLDLTLQTLQALQKDDADARKRLSNRVNKVQGKVEQIQWCCGIM